MSAVGSSHLKYHTYHDPQIGYGNELVFEKDWLLLMHYLYSVKRHHGHVGSLFIVLLVWGDRRTVSCRYFKFITCHADSKHTSFVWLFTFCIKSIISRDGANFQVTCNSFPLPKIWNTEMSIIINNMSLIWKYSVYTFQENNETYFKSRSSGLWRRVFLWYDANVPCHPEDGGSMDLWNVGILPQHYTVSQLRRPRLERSPPWKLQI